MQRLAEDVWRRDPAIAQETVGDLAWMTRQHAGHEDEWRREVWVDGGVVAWSWIKRPARLFWEVDPRRPELLDDVFAWFEAEAARPADVEVVIERRGYGQSRRRAATLAARTAHHRTHTAHTGARGHRRRAADRGADRRRGACALVRDAAHRSGIAELDACAVLLEDP